MRPTLHIAAAVLAVTALAGCYRDVGPQESQQAPPPSGGGSEVQQSPGIGNTPRPGLSGAKRAAQGTAQKLEQRQNEIERAIEDGEYDP